MQEFYSRQEITCHLKNGPYPSGRRPVSIIMLTNHHFSLPHTSFLPDLCQGRGLFYLNNFYPQTLGIDIRYLLRSIPRLSIFSIKVKALL